jgi:hypothetical protein
MTRQAATALLSKFWPKLGRSHKEASDLGMTSEQRLVYVWSKLTSIEIRQIREAAITLDMSSIVKIADERIAN